MTIAVLTNNQSGMVLNAAASWSEYEHATVHSVLQRMEMRSLKDTAEQATHKLTLSCSANTPNQEHPFQDARGVDKGKRCS